MGIDPNVLARQKMGSGTLTIATEPHTGLPPIGYRRPGRRQRVVDARKQSLYFAEDQIVWLKQQASRLDRSHSWIAQRALKIARAEIEAMPSVD